MVGEFATEESSKICRLPNPSTATSELHEIPFCICVCMHARARIHACVYMSKVYVFPLLPLPTLLPSYPRRRKKKKTTSAQESGKAKSGAWRSKWIVLLLLSYHRLPKVHFGWELTTQVLYICTYVCMYVYIHTTST